MYCIKYVAVHESMTRKVESDVLRLIQVSKLHRLRGQWGHLPPQKDGGGGGGQCPHKLPESPFSRKNS